jgi:hypothetical protein
VKSRYSYRSHRDLRCLQCRQARETLLAMSRLDASVGDSSSIVKASLLLSMTEEVEDAKSRTPAEVRGDCGETVTLHLSMFLSLSLFLSLYQLNFSPS